MRKKNDRLICPQGQVLRHTTTDKGGKRTYRSTPKVCRDRPCRKECGASANGQKVIYRHIWQDAMDAAEQIRKTDVGKACMPCANKPLSVSLPMRKKTRHALYPPQRLGPVLRNGSRLSLLP